MKLSEKVAIITGAASGIGQASAVLFAREGAKVVAVDVDQQRGEETAKAIRAEGGTVFSTGSTSPVKTRWRG